MIDITFDKEKNLIHVTRSGEIYAHDLIEYVEKIARVYKEHKRLYILDDTRLSVSKFNSQNDFERIVDVLDRRMSGFVQVYVAIVVDTPEYTALSDIYQQMARKITNYYFRIFSTTEAAYTWLKICQ